jgi:hypothetical protein
VVVKGPFDGIGWHNNLLGLLQVHVDAVCAAGMAESGNQRRYSSDPCMEYGGFN